MNKTAINWTELTWNPWSGCTRVSEGCRYCYAETLAENKRGTAAFPVGFDVTLRPHKLAEPGRVKRGSLIFTNSMTDLFLEDVDDRERDRVLDVMEANPRHRYQVLTKRPLEAARYAKRRALPKCMWLGVTIEHQKTAGRVDVLREIDVPVRFVSAEPLLGALALDLRGIAWVIVGGESGTHLAQPEIAEARAIAVRERVGWSPRPNRAPWVRSLRDQCQAAGTAFWFKQWGGTRPHSAGRTLDGRTWDELPTASGALPVDYAHRDSTPTGELFPVNETAE